MENLRPKRLYEFIGQKKIVEYLTILIGEYRRTNKSLDHILLNGLSGYGKTTLANIIANEIGSKCHILNGGGLTKPKDLLSLLMSVNDFDIIFIDEIHRINKKVQEFLYPVLEDFRLDIGCSIHISHITFIGATTDIGLLLKPFRDRFIHKLTLVEYTKNELEYILKLSCSKIGLSLDFAAMTAIMNRVRGTPRLINNTLKFLKSYASSKGISRLNSNDVDLALLIMGIDRNGFDEDDRRYLETLKRFSKPIGIKTISSITGLDVYTIENVIEPHLLRMGLIEKSEKGRKLI